MRRNSRARLFSRTLGALALVIIGSIWLAAGPALAQQTNQEGTDEDQGGFGRSFTPPQNLGRQPSPMREIQQPPERTQPVLPKQQQPAASQKPREETVERPSPATKGETKSSVAPSGAGETAHPATRQSTTAPTAGKDQAGIPSATSKEDLRNQLLEGATGVKTGTPAAGKQETPPPATTTDVRQSSDNPTTQKPQDTPPPPAQQTTDNPPTTPQQPQQTTSSPPPPPVTPPPPNQASDNPPPPPQPPPTTVSGPPDNPQPVTPSSDTHTTEETCPEDCPQRGKGCIALIIDFSKYSAPFYELAAESVSENLEAAGCVVDYVAPKYQELPKGYYIYQADYSDPKSPPSGGGTAPSPIRWKKVYVKPDPKAVETVTTHNEKEYKYVKDEIEKHRQKLKDGAEIAIEILKGHGSGWEPCGVVGPSEGISTYGVEPDIDRAEFHSGNYVAAHKKVCQWIVVDFSCYAGLTPEAVDVLNNTGAVQCSTKPEPNCHTHAAAYESDIALASSTASDTCNQGTFVLRRYDLNEAISSYMADRDFSGLPAGSIFTSTPRDRKKLSEHIEGQAGNFPSHYSDTGYRKACKAECKVLKREGYWVAPAASSCPDCKVTAAPTPSPNTAPPPPGPTAAPTPNTVPPPPGPTAGPTPSPSTVPPPGPTPGPPK